jgi:hypothetical protein
MIGAQQTLMRISELLGAYQTYGALADVTTEV